MTSNYQTIEATSSLDIDLNLTDEVAEQIERGVKPIRRLARFASSSFTCTIVDQAIAWTLFSLFLQAGMTNDFVRIAAASIFARMVSVYLNFQINSRLVFVKGDSSSARRTFVRFLALATLVLSLSCLGVWVCHEFLGIPDWIAKIGIDFCLFFLNYNAQKRWVFVEETGKTVAEATA